MSKPRRYSNNRVLVFGDTHAPFQHRHTLDFLSDVIKEYKPDRIVHNGDLTDSYWFSQYAKDMVNDTLSGEMKRLRKFVQDLHKICPTLIITDSNHDARLWRKAKIAGIPREFLIPYMKMLGAEGFDWKLVDDFNFTVDADRSNWLVSHWKTGTAMSTGQKLGTNVILSHHHTRQGATRWRAGNKTFWGVDTGCLIDDSSYAFNYSKANALGQVNGCAIIIEGTPITIPLT